MSDRSFRYEIHIAATPEQVWAALTQPEFVSQYWPEWRFETDWHAGSTIRFIWAATGKLYSEGELLAAEQPRLLAFTWPEHGADPNVLPEIVKWEIVPHGASVVILRLIQERISETWYDGATSGWPMVISSIKTLLETGRALPVDGRPQVSMDL